MKKKIFKLAAISLGSLLMLLIVGICVVIYFVFSPSKLTPMVRDIAQEYTNTEVEIGNVELTFFSTFPQFSVKVDELVIPQLNDTISPLLSAKQCFVSVNPFSLLRDKIEIKGVLLDSTDINLYVDSLIGPIKVFKLPSDTTVSDTTDSSNPYGLTLDRVEIKNSNIIIDDRTRDFYTSLQGIDLDLSADLMPRLVDFDMELNLPDIIVENRGVSYARSESLFVDAQMRLNLDSLRLDITRADITVNSIDLQSSGVLSADTSHTKLLVDLSAELTTPSLSEFTRLIPTNYTEGRERLKAEGVVDLAMQFKGEYSKTSKPIITAKLDLVDAKAKYDSRKLSLDDIDCNADIYVDLNKPQNSYAEISKFRLSSSGILDMEVDGRVTNMLSDPYLNLNIKNDFDFNRFTELFPLHEGVTLKGENRSDISIHMALSDIMSSNFGKFYITGESKFSNMVVSVDGKLYTGDSTSTGVLFMDINRADMLFGDNVKKESNSRTLLSTINLSGLGVKDKEGNYVLVKGLDLRAGANFDSKTKEVNGVGVSVITHDVAMGKEELMDVDMLSARATFTISPKRDSLNTRITGTFSSDSLSAYDYINNSEVTLLKSDVDFKLAKLSQKKWASEGVVSFSDFKMSTDLFPLDISLTKSKIQVHDNNIKLKNTRLMIGQSSIVATGNVSNLFASMFTTNADKKKPQLKGRLTVKSKMLHLNELLDAINQSVLLSETTMVEDGEVQDSVVVDLVAVSGSAEEVEALEGELKERAKEARRGVSSEKQLKKEQRQARRKAQKVEYAKGDSTLQIKRVRRDSTQQRRGAKEMDGGNMFLIPKNVDFNLNLNLKKVIYGKGSLDSLVGKAEIKNGEVNLKKLTFQTIGAEAKGSMIYRNVNNRKSRMRMDLMLENVDINRISEILPAIDTLMPMMKSFEGAADLNMRASGVITRKNGFNMASLRAAADLNGRSLVLMDSETFTDLSKMLMFKNKNRNMIDSMDVSVIMDSMRLDVLPFNVVIDRYKAIVGGTQVIDTSYNVDFNYNVSIMKSPLPFKAGVDINGNLDDYDYKVTKAKLKKTDFEAQRKRFLEYMESIE